MDAATLQKQSDEILRPIDEFIMRSKDDKELLMLACTMLSRTNTIFETILGEEGRKGMFRELV